MDNDSLENILISHPGKIMHPPGSSAASKMKHRAKLWSLNSIRNRDNSLKGKILREVNLSLFSSFYGGSLLPHRQHEWEELLGLEQGTLTRYSSTRGLAIFTGLEYLGVFEVFLPLIDKIPHISDLNFIDDGAGYGFWGNLAVSSALNLGFRYPLSKKGKAIPPISLFYAPAVITIDFAGRNAKKFYNLAKKHYEKLSTIK